MDRNRVLSSSGQDALLALRLRLRDEARGLWRRPEAARFPELRMPNAGAGKRTRDGNSSDVAPSSLPHLDTHKGALHQPERRWAPSLRRTRHQGVFQVGDVREVLGGYGTVLGQRRFNRPDRYKRGLQPRE